MTTDGINRNGATTRAASSLVERRTPSEEMKADLDRAFPGKFVPGDSATQSVSTAADMRALTSLPSVRREGAAKFVNDVVMPTNSGKDFLLGRAAKMELAEQLGRQEAAVMAQPGSYESKAGKLGEIDKALTSLVQMAQRAGYGTEAADLRQAHAQGARSQQPPRPEGELTDVPARPPVNLGTNGMPAGRPAAGDAPTASGPLASPEQIQSAPAQAAAQAMTKQPDELTHTAKLNEDGTRLQFDPKPGEATRGRSTRSVANVQRTEAGGVSFELEGKQGPDGKNIPPKLEKAEWVTSTLRDVINTRIADPNKREAALRQFDSAGLDTPRSFLKVMPEGGKDSNDMTLFTPRSRGSRTEVIAICSEAQSISAGGGGGMARKPVVYLYPERPTDVTVRVQLEGEFSAQYPKADGDTWRFFAQPDGMLFDRKTERRYSYLFWEGVNPKSWSIDPAQAFCVESAQVEQFLDGAAGRFGLNDRERTDFISYWLPALEKNRHSLVQFLDDQTYERFAKMDVTPTPTSVIRLFMVFKAVDAPVPTGNPNLSLKFRKGFTVVEWGGCNLDEQTTG